MKIKILLISCLLFPTIITIAQQSKPAGWNDIIQKSWYYGTVNDKPAFVYLEETTRGNAYFFAATTSLPEIYPVQIKWKLGNPRSVSFLKGGKKVKAKFSGIVQDDTLSGLIRTNRKNAIRLGIPTELPLYMVKEAPCHSASPLPCLPPTLPPRYSSPIFNKVNVLENISYGAATGYYTSLPVEVDAGYNYQQIILEAMQKMYVSPTKQALLHILNMDPVSIAITDLQGLRFDLYQPAGDTLRKRPLIMLLHGGAFIMGDKGTATMRELANDFARKGYVVASINYRIGFNPASRSSLERSAYRAVQDARAALRYLAFHAQTYRIDPDCIFLGGSSAGAITALNVAFMEEDERPESTRGNIWRLQKDLGGLDESTNNIQSAYTIRAVANLWGAVNDTNIIDSYEKLPVLSFHGDADKIVPPGYDYPFIDLDTNLTSNIVTKLFGSLYIDRRLKNLGIPSELVLFPGAGHEPQFEPEKYRMIMDTITEKVTDFYFHSLFHFPEITGPLRIAVGTSPSTYIVPHYDEITYYWQVEGGKIIPGSPKNIARIAWLAEENGKVKLVMVHKNMANAEVEVIIKLPERRSF
jgi:pimeloyl-ACP methyl ester carboxylesterase